MERRENDGYCFIKSRVRPSDILQALNNIPYELLPPALKEVEDFLVNLGIKKSYHNPPQLNKIERDLSDSNKKATRMLKNIGKENPLEGLIPVIHGYSKCDYGQKPIEMAKNIKLRELYLAIEEGLYNMASMIKLNESLMNEKAIELAKNDIPIYYTYPPDKISHYTNKLATLGAKIYGKKYTDFDTKEVLDVKKEIENTTELRKAFDFNSKEYEELSDKISELSDKRNKLQEKARKDFKESLRGFWVNEWYDKYAWDYDENERNELENPYKKEE